MIALALIFIEKITSRQIKKDNIGILYYMVIDDLYKSNF